MLLDEWESNTTTMSTRKCNKWLKWRMRMRAHSAYRTENLKLSKLIFIIRCIHISHSSPPLLRPHNWVMRQNWINNAVEQLHLGDHRLPQAPPSATHALDNSNFQRTPKQQYLKQTEIFLKKKHSLHIAAQISNLKFQNRPQVRQKRKKQENKKSSAAHTKTVRRRGEKERKCKINGISLLSK